MGTKKITVLLICLGEIYGKTKGLTAYIDIDQRYQYLSPENQRYKNVCMSSLIISRALLSTQKDIQLNQLSNLKFDQ